MKDISIILAFSAGLLSFLSPCVLPLVPAYIGYVTGVSLKEVETAKVRSIILLKSIGFVIGFSIIFILMGASITTFGKLFVQNQFLFRKIGGVIMLIFGLHTLGVFKIKLFYYEKRAFPLYRIQGQFSSVLMGMAFAAGWTPCVGPILSTILIYAGSMQTINKGILLLVFYSFGLGVPFIITALAMERFSKGIRKFSKYTPVVSIISGVLIILMGILLLTNKVNVLSQYLNLFKAY